jgi:hypothetical protein
MQNRRAHPRFDTSLSLEIYTGNDVIPAEAKNLSQGGVGIFLATPLPVKAPVGLSMFLVEEGIEDERTAPLNLQGEVMWCTTGEQGGFLAGVRFVTLQPQDLQRLQHFLQRLYNQA